jgi:uncharacterized protein YjiS (DUF1127 family)
MTKDSTLRRPGTADQAVVRLVLALAAWRKRLAVRRRAYLGRRHIDGLSRHMLKDIGLSRWSEIGGRD